MAVFLTLIGFVILAGSVLWLSWTQPLIERAWNYPSDTVAAVVGWVAAGIGAVLLAAGIVAVATAANLFVTG